MSGIEDFRRRDRRATGVDLAGRRSVHQWAGGGCSEHSQGIGSRGTVGRSIQVNPVPGVVGGCRIVLLGVGEFCGEVVLLGEVFVELGLSLLLDEDLIDGVVADDLLNLDVSNCTKIVPRY